MPTMVAFRRQTSQHKRYTTGSVSVNNAAARASTKALARPSRATSLEEGDPGSCGTHLFRCGLPHTSTPLFAGGEGTRVRFAQKAPLSNCLSMTSRCVVSSIGSRDLDAAVLLPPSPMILDRRDALSLLCALYGTIPPRLLTRVRSRPIMQVHRSSRLLLRAR